MARRPEADATRSGAPAPLRIFCDFDGTIAVKDVGNELFTRYGDRDYWRHLVKCWHRGEIDGRQLWQRQCERSRLTPQELDAFAQSQELDPWFPSFYQFCRQRALPLYVVSDGMDAYIRRILERHQITEVLLRCNHLRVEPDGRLSVVFPYYEQSCGRCANCKGSHIRRERRSGETTLYVGDGLSDLCAVGAADILLAKKQLRTYCEDKGVGYIAYENFAHVQAVVERVLAGQAETED
ncbi:MAG TPA: MtnX-like HAD-IB family phosphatase [bacterium]|nr:MtnX-like HAD-IB family phosphatase [bacterium]